ncbi:MAG: hypothetical protein E6R03_07955 [Hyphomicrobiaceae bacterium]|nr:MAG: hypothetical protein E6R03_07955 [Hyphomicrobiaceae bacterium]
MARDKNLDAKMDQIANYVADKILEGLSVDKELNDAFKTLTSYWTAASKLDKVPGGDDGSKSSGFDGMKSRIAQAGRTDEQA